MNENLNDKNAPTAADKGQIAEKAKEILDVLKKDKLPIWQAKETLREAARQLEWAIFS